AFEPDAEAEWRCRKCDGSSAALGYLDLQAGLLHHGRTCAGESNNGRAELVDHFHLQPALRSKSVHVAIQRGFWAGARERRGGELSFARKDRRKVSKPIAPHHGKAHFPRRWIASGKIPVAVVDVRLLADIDIALAVNQPALIPLSIAAGGDEREVRD